MAVIAEVNVTGLAELRRALRQVDRTILPELREGLKGAVEIVAAEVRSTMPKDTGRAAASVRAVAGGNTIYLVGGKARVPYFGWLEFGGKLPDKRPRTKKALAWGGADHPSAHATGAERPKVREGRYMYPAVKRNTPQIVEAAGDAFDDAARRAGLL